MACTNKKLQPNNLVEDLNTLSVFGKCQRKDLIFTDDERKEKEKAFVKRQTEIQKELERQERLRKEQEISDREMRLEEEKGLNRRQRTGIKYYVPPSKSRGRGSLLNGAVEDDGVEAKGRGRGRLSPKEKDCLPLFDRECRVQNNLNKFSDSKLHNNQYQKMYWTELGANKNAEQDESYDPEIPENGTSYEPYIAENYNRYTPESSFTSDQFEDAVGSSQSNSPLSFTSVQSRSSGSPALPAWPNPEPPAQQPRAGPEVLFSAPCARRPRGNRIAARFTYNLEEDDVPNCTPDETIGKEDDFLAVLGSSQAPLAPSGFRMGRRSSGTSFKNLHPSQRVLSSDILQPLDLHCAIAGPKNNFTLNMKDFPAL